jgi:hypothetical protein
MRKAAKGECCTLRIPGVCNHGTETTVLAHLRMFGWAGMAQKPPDFLGVFACHPCHDALDGRAGAKVSHTDILRALGETLIRQHKLGNLKLGE